MDKFTCEAIRACAVVTVNQVRTCAAIEASIVTRRRDTIVDVGLAKMASVTGLASAAVQDM